MVRTLDGNSQHVARVWRNAGLTKTNKQYQLHEMFDPIMIGKGRGSTCNILHKIGEMGSSSPRLAKACRTRPLASLGKASHMALSPQIMAEIM